MQFPINIGLHRSFFLGLAIAGLHLAALVAVLVPPWLLWLKASLLAAIVASAAFAWCRRSPAVRSLRLLGDGSLECQMAAGGSFVEAELQQTATVHPWLTVVPMAVGGRKMVLAVLPDSMPPEDYRRLRVWLRWRAEFSGAKNAV